TGEAIVAGDRYVGLRGHPGARIFAGAHRGQVVISHTNPALLVEDEELLGELDFGDLGPRSLKNFDRPVRIYQLLAPDLPAEFPDLRVDEGAQARGSTELADQHEVAQAEDPSSVEDLTGRVRVLIVDDQALVRT